MPRNGKDNIDAPSTSKKAKSKHCTGATKKTCDLTKKREKGSEQTLSIKSLEFPSNKDDKGAFKVKDIPNLQQSTKSISDISLKGRGYDFTSSTNSHFEDWLFPVPRKFRPKCPSTSSTDHKIGSPSTISETIVDKPEVEEKQSTSQEMVNSRRIFSEKPKHFNGPEWRKPCKESFVAGAPQKYVGNCKHNIQEISKMSKERQKFFLTQDPRKVHCLVNPDVLRAKKYTREKEFDTLTKMVKHAQNTCESDAGSDEPKEQFLCEVIDMENPLEMDFQGLDYKNTYQKDEQDLLNQRNYLRMCRYIERKRVKAETKVKVEEEKRQEKIQTPVCFKVRDRRSPEPVIPPPTVNKLAILLRSEEKPSNRKKIEMERERREQRYTDLFVANRTRKEKEEEAAKALKKDQEENAGLISADNKFKDIVDHIDTVVNRTFKSDTKKTKETAHTKSNVTSRSQTRSQKNAVGKMESYNFDKTSLSSANEDDIAVGKEGNFFRLRSLQSKSSKTIKGRILDPTITMLHTCKTREQWLMELVRKKEKVKLDVELGAQKPRSPDDPKLLLFDPNINYTPPKREISEVREFKLKPLGRHYDRELRKSIRFTKPRLKYSVKKFNLVGYRFGDTAKRLSEIKDPIAELERSKVKLSTTLEYIEEKALERRKHQEEMKIKRLEMLGIPCKKIKKSRLQTKCENSSSSSDSEWVPDKESDYCSDKDEKEDKNIMPIMPLSMRTNMPAPKFREPTLRQHPRRRRDYDAERVPSEIFDEVVIRSKHPHMYKLPPDVIKPANAHLKKRPYYEMFEARHHHDHWVPTQERMVDVHYQPQLVMPKITEVKRRADRFAAEKFDAANPPCNQFVKMNLTMPEWDMDDVIREYRMSAGKESVKFTKGSPAGAKKNVDSCKQKDYVFHSRDPKELEDLDYPGRKEYLALLRDVKLSLKESKHSENPSEELFVNKAAALEDVEEDVKSIESCLTSLNSSECTNLTNDSGSLIVMEGKEKVPLDFIRKSLVPFEELQRSRFQAEPIDFNQEEANPFNVLPFSGQGKAHRELIRPKDSFFTFTTRLKNGLRLRLEVPVEDVRKKLIGKGVNKYSGLVATDIDENYVEVLKCRPSVRSFNFKTGRPYIKDALRLKFESMLIQGQMVRTKIYNRLNEQHWTDMQRLKVLYDKLFAKWEKKEYEAAMSVVYKVKSFYDITDRLKNELKALDRDLVILNMDIVFIEGHWIRCVMLQNFHYLMGNEEWRFENDWIHRLPGDSDEVAMENFEDSIMKRSKINIRQREKDDAWAIKSFYEEVYLPNKHTNLIVFPDAESFLQGLENLKGKTFILLLEMHFTLAIHTELQGKLETFVDWCSKDLNEKKEYVDRKCAKLYFMEGRSNWLKSRTLDYLGHPIDESFNDEEFLRHHGIITEAWRRVVPANMRGGGEQLEPVDMVAMMSDVVMEAIAKFESIPMDESLMIENKVRSRRSYLRNQSRNACFIERRIDQEMKKVIKNLEPPTREIKPPGKRQRYLLKKQEKVVKIQEKKISEKAQFFFQAFNEYDEMTKATDIRDSIAQVDTIQEQIVPFYFDHFLKLNGYTPNYNFKTQVEIRDGPELERMVVRHVIPDIQRRMVQWELAKRKVMDDNIAQNPKMYVDVV